MLHVEHRIADCQSRCITLEQELMSVKNRTEEKQIRDEPRQSAAGATG